MTQADRPEQGGSLTDIPVFWGNTPQLKRLQITASIKAHISRGENSIVDVLTYLAKNDPDEFEVQLAHLLLLFVTEERVKRDHLMRELVKPMADSMAEVVNPVTQAPVSPTPEQLASGTYVGTDGVEVVNGYRKELLQPDYEYPYEAKPSEITDDEAQAYLDRMADSLKGSEHYDQVRGFFGNRPTAD